MLLESKFRLGSGLAETWELHRCCQAAVPAAPCRCYSHITSPGPCPQPLPSPLEPFSQTLRALPALLLCFNINSHRAGRSLSTGLSSPKPGAPGDQVLGSSVSSCLRQLTHCWCQENVDKKMGE